MYMIRIAVAITLTLLTAISFAQVGENDGLSDPNLIDEGQLQDVAQIDSSLAASIISGRPYLTAKQLDEVLAAALSEGDRESIYRTMFRQINLNNADRAEIMLIPDMSSRMAHEFEEYRPYTSLEQFRREMGKYVDEEEVARLEQYVFIPLDLNTATSDDLMTIPGMSSRMVHEFEEYRPYTSMEQFRREIGKYVDENEVARLESYVVLK